MEAKLTTKLPSKKTLVTILPPLLQMKSYYVLHLKLCHQQEGKENKKGTDIRSKRIMGYFPHARLNANMHFLLSSHNYNLILKLILFMRTLSFEEVKKLFQGLSVGKC